VRGVLASRQLHYTRPRQQPAGTHSVQRSKVTTDTSNLVLKDLVEEPSLELSLPRGRGSDITGLLASPEDDKVLLRREGGRVQRGIGLVGLERPQGIGFDQLLESAHRQIDLHICTVATHLCRFVLGSGKEVRSVGSHLDVGDLHVGLVRLRVLDELSRLPVVLAHGSVVVAGDDELVEIAPGGDGSLALAEGDGEDGRFRLLGVDIDRDREHDHGAEMSHAHLRDGQQQRAVVRELDPLDGRREVPCLQAQSGPHLPQLDRVVGRSGGEQRGRGIDIDRPQRSLVALVCSETLAVRLRSKHTGKPVSRVSVGWVRLTGVPSAHYVVLRSREQKVTCIAGLHRQHPVHSPTSQRGRVRLSTISVVSDHRANSFPSELARRGRGGRVFVRT